MSAAPVVTCPDCVGTAATRHPYPCHRCGRRGRRRAQLVVTVANLDTGAVVSLQVVPGGLEPHRDPAGGWGGDLPHRVRELAASVGAVLTDPDLPALRLDPQWRPDLPAARRHELEAHAILRLDHAPWRLLLGRSTAPPPVDPAARLVRLCALADLLLLDLVVEARRRDTGFGWTIRYEVPGSPMPTGLPGPHRDLPAALTHTDVADALTGLAERGLAAPARTLRPDSPRPPAAPAVDLDQLARRILADSVDPAGDDDRGDEVPGAQARWRDGRWWHTPVRPGEPLTRGHQPADPTWLGEPVNGRPCPDCRGAGHRPPSPRCWTCGDTRRLHQALHVTVTDLRHRVVHLAWRAGTPEVTPLVATQPGGRPIVRLPARYRLGAWAAVLGGRPEDLADADGGHEIGKDLRDGYVALPWFGADPVGEQVRHAGRGTAAGRLIVTTAPPDAPPLPELLRLTLGLDLALVVSVCDLRQHANDPHQVDGLRWSVDVRPGTAPVDPDALPDRPSLAAALAWCVECLTDTVAGAAPINPAALIPAPRSGPRDLPADPEPDLLRLAARHAGQVVTVRFTRAGCAVHRHDDDGVRLIAKAPDLHGL